MKLLTVIIHENAQQAVSDRLRELDAVPGFTFARVEGHGPHSAEDIFLSSRDRVMGYVPRIAVYLVVADEAVGGVLAALRQEAAGAVYWVTAVENTGRL